MILAKISHFSREFVIFLFENSEIFSSNVKRYEKVFESAFHETKEGMILIWISGLSRVKSLELMSKKIQ